MSEARAPPGGAAVAEVKVDAKDNRKIIPFLNGFMSNWYKCKIVEDVKINP